MTENNTTPEPQETTVLTAEEVIEAFEVVYEELVILRNSVINLHERLQKLEPPVPEATNEEQS